MSTNEILQNQISSEVEGKTSIKVYFSDCDPETISIFGQDRYFIKVLFSSPKNISKKKYNDLVSQFTGEQEYNTDPEIIRTELSYNEFMDKYYNLESCISSDEREELIQALIPSESEYLFEDGSLDIELKEVQIAYANLPDDVAEDYLQYVLKSLSGPSYAVIPDEDPEPPEFLSARAFVEGRLNALKNALEHWEEK